MVDHWFRLVSIYLPLIFLLFDVSLQQQSLVSRHERTALLQLRSSLGLRARDWPLKSNPCSSWVGIHCTNGRVTEINISGFRRTRRGSRNPQFAVEGLRNLTSLSSFNASNFALPGPIPDWFGLGLVPLRVLDLRSCSITGSIPATLGNLSSLVQFYLSDNALTGVVPPSLSRLIGLSVLDLSRNSLSGTISVDLAGLVNLTVLDLSSNSLSDAIPPQLGEMSRLIHLNLSRNNLSSSIPPQLGNASSLVDLDLGYNLLSGLVPSGLSSLRSLRRLVIENNRLLGQLPGNLFAPLTQLQFVVLGNNGFTGNLPDNVWSIPSLLLLDVSMNNFTGVLPNASSSSGASLVVANISWNSFYGVITPVVRRFSSVDLSGNYLEGVVPDYARGNSVFLTQNCLRNTTDQRRAEDCTAFYAGRNLTFDNFGEPTVVQPPITNANRKSHRSTIILASVLGSVGIIALVILSVILFILCKRKRRVTNQRGISVGPGPAEGSPSTPGIQFSPTKVGDLFTYQQILQATEEFSDENLIKHGHSGDLFYGTLEGGLPVVIKRVNLSSSIKKESYVSEMELFSKISHPRLVPFLGHCLENENQKFLVYKHMPNRDLSTALFKKKTSDDSLQSLDWITRLKIAIGAAEGLSYLHHECDPPLVHCDVQASSILLDDKFEVRLASLSEVCVQEGDSHQNRISRFLRFPQLLEQGSSGAGSPSCAYYDVYCFGKVLLELVTGKLGISSSTDSMTKEWLEKTLPYISIYDKELVTNIIDPSLVIYEDLLEEVWAMAIVARSCLNPKPARRPLMRYILKALENPLKVVREEQGSSARLRTTSSRGSWNASALFGSWRLSSSDVAAVPGGGAAAAASRSFKRSGTTGSQGSGQHDGTGNGLSLSPSTRHNSREIFPEPAEGRAEAAN